MTRIQFRLCAKRRDVRTTLCADGPALPSAFPHEDRNDQEPGRPRALVALSDAELAARLEEI
jgi:hypothetical protein